MSWAADLCYLNSFRSAPGPLVIPCAPLPITDDEVAAWVKRHPFVRSALAPHVARSLAYLERFRREGA